MTESRPSNRQLVLSLFPGVGLLDRAFVAENFCVVTGPDRVTGGDVREFAGVSGIFDGLIAGPPCQGFSSANMQRKNADHQSVVNSRLMLQETCRVITECQPVWFLIENVPGVPDVRVEGYSVQRIPITDLECGGLQLRSRHVQFGHCYGWIIRPERVNDCTRNRKKGRPAKATTTKTDRWTDYPDHCRRQGLDEPLQLPGWTKTAKYRAVGNGVPVRMGRVLAAAVLRAGPPTDRDCTCGCGRVVTHRGKAATVSCRKRLQMSRDSTSSFVTVDGYFHAEEQQE